MSKCSFSSALALVLVMPGLRATPPVDASSLIVRADRVRTAWTEAVLTVRVTVEAAGKPTQSGEFEIFVKGRDFSLVFFLAPEDRGKGLLTRGNDAWLFLPRTRNPIKVPRSHRLSGGFSVTDVARVRFSEDYEAIPERRDGDLEVLRLMEKPGLSLQFPAIRVWIDPKEGVYRKAEFLLRSGKKAKEVHFEEYRVTDGQTTVGRMTIIEGLTSGRTRVEYLKFQKKEIPAAFFDFEAVKKHLSGAAEVPVK